jgi:hypothetical protein
MTDVMRILENISVQMLEHYIDVPDTAVLGTSAYADLMKQMAINRGVSHMGGMTSIQVYTSAANLKVLVSYKVAPDHVSIGTIGKETFDLLKTLGRLGIHYEDPFTYGFTY